MCFSLLWVIQLLVWLVVIGAVVAIFKLLLPYVLSLLGVAGDIVLRVINIIVVAVVVIALLWFVYDLIACVGLARPSLR